MNCDTDAELISFASTRAAAINVTVEAYLMTPKGPGPFPTIVMLPSARGLEPPHCYAAKQRMFREWGYASLVVDYYSAGNRLHGFRLDASAFDLMRDTQFAAEHLRTLPAIDGHRLALIGWSRGGVAALHAVTSELVFGPRAVLPFAAVASFYPTCPQSYELLAAPLLIIHGSADAIAPSVSCRNVPVQRKTDLQIELLEFPQARHRFDFAYHPAFDAKAAAVANRRMRRFLGMHLR